jgi:CBS domain-containing protein
MTVLARHMMRPDVVTLSPEFSLIEAHRVLMTDEITGAPVVDKQGQVCGVISSSDLIRAVANEHDMGLSRFDYFRGFVPYSGQDWASGGQDFENRLREVSVADVMAKQIVSVGPDDSIQQVARTLTQHHVHRVLVVEQGKLLGIISSFDFVSLFA